MNFPNLSIPISSVINHVTLFSLKNTVSKFVVVVVVVVVAVHSDIHAEILEWVECWDKRTVES